MTLAELLAKIREECPIEPAPDWCKQLLEKLK